MLRAVSKLYLEGTVADLLACTRRDLYKGFRTSAPVAAAAQSQSQRVLAAEAAPAPPESPPPLPPRPPPPTSPPRRPRALTAAAALAASIASVGAVYLYTKLTDEDQKKPTNLGAGAEHVTSQEPPPYPASGASLPPHVQYLVVGGGTAAFAALRAIRSARPAAGVLLVTEERALPYMRPPLSKELWAEPQLAARGADPDRLTFRQWNGRRRSITYEPEAFYTPVERLAESETGGVGVARGWRVDRLSVRDHSAQLSAPHQPPVTVKYDKCLIATGSRPKRLGALRAAAAAGRSVVLRSVQDAARLAALLDAPDTRRVAIVGGGFLATELAAALAARLSGSGKQVVQVFREEACMARVLPAYLAADVTRRLHALGALTMDKCEVVDAAMCAGRVRLQLAAGGALDADVVVECVGAEPDTRLAAASRLELDAACGGVLVNAELQARTDVWAAGDVAAFHDELLGRRRVEHHDHAVVSGRLAGENMAALHPPKHYQHQSMFWSDLGPDLGYEAIGIIDASLPTVGVFCEDAVRTEEEAVREEGAAREEDIVRTEEEAVREEGVVRQEGAAREEGVATAGTRRYERGVVFYLRERRVVGVLLYNLFNRMHTARQVLATGEFEDLLEVGKLFAPHQPE